MVTVCSSSSFSWMPHSHILYQRDRKEMMFKKKSYAVEILAWLGPHSTCSLGDAVATSFLIRIVFPGSRVFFNFLIYHKLKLNIRDFRYGKHFFLISSSSYFPSFFKCCLSFLNYPKWDFHFTVFSHWNQLVPRRKKHDSAHTEWKQKGTKKKWKHEENISSCHWSEQSGDA